MPPTVHTDRMGTTKLSHAAPGGPGMPPRWTRGAKRRSARRTRRRAASGTRVSAGILTEMFYPTIDTRRFATCSS